ncbi:cocaine esterase (plasmid) [Maritalea myrionectae]|uniref:Cocaine esterase n=1 Tax=Maritalea myrionectae TaxID=454601 RepID=A0A2R4MJG5_9HYPH|nr:CocE/NonD family hydrolase [Maritalea myrionectae]AVX06066.1 cocaine esterase [Maritalea myrionectae]
MNVLLNETALPFRSSAMVTMRDGVRLATDIYLPDGPGPWPVIIERTPYNRRGISNSEVSAKESAPKTRVEIAAWFRNQGYAVVMQDVRGRNGSEGQFTKYVNEAEDGFDTFSWIVDQHWCDGSILTIGLSYGAHTQLAAACAGAPGLAAMCVDTGGLYDLKAHSIRYGGAFELKQLTWAYKHARLHALNTEDNQAAAALEATDISEVMFNDAWEKGNSPLSVLPTYENSLFQLWNNDLAASDYEGPATCARRWIKNIPDIPICLIGSWNDPYANSMLDLHKSLKQHITKPLRLIMGPWLHGKRSQSNAGDADFGPKCTIDALMQTDFLDFRHKWFQFALGKSADPLCQNDYFFEMGPTPLKNSQYHHWPLGGTWRVTRPDEKLDSQHTQFRLVGDTLRSLDGTKGFSEAHRLRIDPAKPFPTIGGAITSGEPVMRGGMYLLCGKDVETSIFQRDDFLLYQSVPLLEEMSIIGSPTLSFMPPRAHQGFDVSVTLLQTMTGPDGQLLKCANITDGILRLAKDAAGIQKVRLMATDFCFAKGDRIGVLIAGANFPRFDLNPGYGRKMPMQRDKAPSPIIVDLSDMTVCLPTSPRFTSEPKSNGP